MNSPRRTQPSRRGVIVVFSALLMIVIFAMAAMAVDVGYLAVIRTQLQAAADAGALAAGNAMHLSESEICAVGTDYVTRHIAGGRMIKPVETKVELGVWNMKNNTFTPTSTVGNAVRVTARREKAKFMFAFQEMDVQAQAITMANPKDVAFVIDLSGSMNDDTEPAWATPTVNAEFAPTGYPNVGDQLMDQLYADFD